MKDMDILPTNFKVLRFCGTWKEWEDDNIYTIFLLIYGFTILDEIKVISTRDHVQELTEGLFLGLTFFTLCAKYANFLLRENELSDLLDCLCIKMCPRNSTEKLIMEEHSRRANKWSTISFMMISYMTRLGFITPVLGLFKGGERVLPLKSYMPYSVSNLLSYLAKYLQQFLALFYAIILNVTFEIFPLRNICGISVHFYLRYAIFLLIYEFTILDVIEVIRTRDHIQELTEGLFLGLTFFTLCVKYANFLLRENELSDLLDCLRLNMCQPRNSTEKLIIEEHSRKAKWSTISFMMVSYASAVIFMVTPVLRIFMGSGRVLPLKTYMPYSVSNLLPYLATYLQQFLAMFYAILLNVSFDSLVYGFTIQACAQIDLMCCRLTDSLKNTGDIFSDRKPETNASIVECVKHHLLVSILVKKIRALFIWTVMIFFFFSLLIVCTSTFLLSKKKLLSIEFLSMLVYLSDMLLQLFYYCWYGNELELKSKGIASAIYFSDWTMVTPRERRSLMLIMISSQKGIMFSYHGIFALSLNTFTLICRTSYSAYNLLQGASN